MGQEGELDERTLEKVLRAQQNEITEFEVYSRIQDRIENAHNKNVIKRIADEEMSHYQFFKKYTGKDLEPSRFKVTILMILCRLLGLTFATKLMEKGEEDAQEFYGGLKGDVAGIEDIISDEDSHEKQLIDLLDEERLEYTGSIVLGINDALVELTGALAGLTLALQNTLLVATTGLITGIAASLSMAASEYLSTKSEADTSKNPARASIYTGGAYILTVGLLIAPYMLFDNVYYSLGLTLFNAILVILLFTFYISVARDLDFKRRFAEMAGISLGVAGLSFLMGYVIRIFFGVEV
jgi:VIT1/CCC1 family predicted Fe2+/Mn2+ transporter